MNIELMKQSQYRCKVRAFKRQQEKFFKVRNNLNLIRFSNRSGNHINCFRFSLSEGKEHIYKKLEVCIDLMKENHKFITEAIFVDGGRADVFDITEGVVYEVVNSESDREFIEKVKRYPDDVEVV
ncbi:MAG: hypothetical protein KJ674_00105, partial [Nanoarchaeota archaeon]|nr:hypothetical protein [Nanoarchaeota archaeon]